MRLAHGRLLTYCPDVPRDGSWAETFAALRGQVPAARDHARPQGERFGISLPLGVQAASELTVSRVLARFRQWLREERCEVCAVNDSSVANSGWTRPERLVHTCRLLDLLGELLPEGVTGSLGARLDSCDEFSEPQRTETTLRTMYANFIQVAVHAADVSGSTGRRLQFALEPIGPDWLAAGLKEASRFLEPLAEAFPDQFGVCFDADRSVSGPGEVASALSALDRAEVAVVKMRLRPAWDHPTTGDALDWLAANRSRCPCLELHVHPRDSAEEATGEAFARGFDRVLALLAARGLA